MNWDLATEEPNRAEQFGQFGSLNVGIAQRNTKCRVIAVSGLASNPHWEWTFYSPETRIACDWLTELLPRHTRGSVIETFRYNLLPGSIGGFLSEEGLTNAANRLLRMIERTAVGVKPVPIVFVAHDLGGIVVKKALLIAREKERYKSFVRNAKRIIFFGTPHRALDEDSWEDLVLSIILASPAKLRMIPNLSTRLGRLSPFLEEVSRSFLNVSAECRFMSVYQEMDSESKDRPVLPPYSATMGVVHEIMLPRQTKHEDLVTFSSDDDLVFLDIAEAIRYDSREMYCNNLMFLSRKYPPNELFQTHDDELHRFLELSHWKSSKTKTKPETLVFLDEHFSNTNTLVAIGESGLDARALFQCLRSHSLPVIYYAYSPHNIKLQAPGALWGSLVLQILLNAPYLFNFIEPLSVAMSKSNAWTSRNFAKLFRRLLLNMSLPKGKDGTPLYIIVENMPLDAPRWKDSMKFLHSLLDIDNVDESEENKTMPNLRLILLYDRRVLYQSSLHDTPWCEENVVDPVSVFGKETLTKFSGALVAATYPAKQQHAVYQSLIVDDCGYDAEMIYGLRAVIKEDPTILDYRSPSSPKLPIWDIFSNNVKRAFHRSPPWAKAAIGWIVYAKRPLTVEELRSGMRLSSSSLPVPENMLPSLKAAFGALIYATSKRICFPGKVIGGFFRNCLEWEQQRLKADRTPTGIPDDKVIADVLVLVSSMSSVLPRIRASMQALSGYAIDFWRQHLEDGKVELSKVVSVSENEALMAKQRKMEKEYYWSRFRRAGDIYLEGALVFSVQVGIPSIVAQLLEDATDSNEIAGAVAMAARYHHTEILEMLLASDKLVDGSDSGLAIDTALEIGAVTNSSALYKPLLSWMEKSSNQKARARRKKLMSHVACHAAIFGYTELLKLVVQEHGADVDVLNDGSMKPLRLAVCYGNVGCTKFLVEETKATIYEVDTGLDDDEKSDAQSISSEEAPIDMNLLVPAAERGYNDIVTLLLDHTVILLDDPNGKSAESAPTRDTEDNQGDEGRGKSRTKSYTSWSNIQHAIVAACKQNCVETVKLILQHPTIAAVPRSHRPASSDMLCAAIRTEMRPGDESLAMLLLNSSKPVKQPNELAHPFIRACEYGHLEFVNHCFELCDSIAALNLVNGSDSDDRMALHCAAVKGHGDIVEVLLQKGADPNVADESEMTPLALAAVAGHVETVRLLLKNGADAAAWVGRTTQGILALAAMSRSCEREVGVIHLLLQNGAPVNALDGSKHTALHWAAQRGHINILEALLAQNGVDVTITGDREMNALHSAAQSSARTAVLAAEMLVAAGISTQKTDIDGWLPLHLAACWSGVDMMQFLLGGDKSAVYARATNGDTVLHAAYKTCEALIWLIDQGFDVDMENNEGRTVLMHAAKNGVDETIGILLAFGANTDLLDRSNRSALHHAVETRSQAAAHKLLDANKAVLFQLDSNGMSVLYTAITRGLVPLALRVLDCMETYAIENNMEKEMARIFNADSTTTRRSPLILAAKRGDDEVVVKMVELGADMELRDYNNLTALSYTIQRGNIKTARILLEAQQRLSKQRRDSDNKGDGGNKIKPGNKSKDSGKDLGKTRDEDGPSIVYAAPLQIAASSGNTAMVDLLLSYGADVDEESGQFNTALTAAASGGFSRAVNMLLEAGADATLGGGSYPNALSAAVSSTSSATIDLLLAENASSVLARDIQGRNALHVAVQSRALDAFEKLLAVAENLSHGGEPMPFGNALDPDKQGRRLLHFAASSSDVDTLRYFLEHPRLQLKNEIDILDNDGWTPLHWACRLEEGEEVVQLLLENGSDPSLETRDGWTPLNIAQYHDAAETLPAITMALEERAEKIAARNAGKAATDDDGKLEPEGPEDKHVAFKHTNVPLAPGHSNWAITCDGCYLMPTIGACYKCMDCADFDLCFKCHWSAEHTHFAGHKWKLREGTEDPGDSRRPPYGQRASSRVRSRVRSKVRSMVRSRDPEIVITRRV